MPRCWTWSTPELSASAGRRPSSDRRAQGTGSISTWVLEGDAAREQFLSGAGLGPDGTARTLAAGPERDVVERRWYAEI